MRIGILFNCQHRVLADVLRLARPDFEVVEYDIGQLRLDHAARDQALETLAGCDRVLSLYLEPADGPLGSEALHETARRLIILPGFSFGGFHPDTVYVHTAQGFLDGVTDHYHSRIAVAGFLAGRGVGGTVSLYNSLVMGRAGYFTAYGRERMLVCQVFDRFGIDLNPLFERWAGQGCFMHSVNHPKVWCYADVALALCRHAGFVNRDATFDFSAMQDGLAVFATHPILPPLARRLGLPAEHRFKPFAATEDHAVNLERFVELEFERFEHAVRADLEATPGVATLRAVLA